MSTFLTACGRSQQGLERVETYPITGQVSVDGKPVANLLVKCQPVGDVARGNVPTASAFTDEQGKFEIGTYESADGAPEGEYVLTFAWQERSLLTGRYEGPDKLKGRYSDPEKSQVHVTVKAGEKNELQEIRLTTQQ